MKFKGIGNWSELRLSGIWAWIHRLVMLITFPIRRFWQILLVVLAVGLLFLIIHSYYGIGLSHISNWKDSFFANEKITEVKEKTISNVTERVEQIKNTVSEAIATQNGDTPQGVAEPERKHFVAWNVPEFKKAKYKPTAGFSGAVVRSGTRKTASKPRFEKAHIDEEKNIAEVEAEEENIAEAEAEEVLITTAEVLAENKQEEPLIEKPKKIEKVKTPTKDDFYGGELADYYEVAENRGLVYLQKPEVLYGAAEIVGPNSLYVDDTFVFLYGIYTDRKEYDYAAAKAYLADLTAKKLVRCEIVAYAAQTRAATALCFIEGTFINKAMVQRNLAQNIALK